MTLEQIERKVKEICASAVYGTHNLCVTDYHRTNTHECDCDKNTAEATINKMFQEEFNLTQEQIEEVMTNLSSSEGVKDIDTDTNMMWVELWAIAKEIKKVLA